MARLMSDAKKGFYPTNVETVKKVIDKLIIFNDKKQTTAVDCCSGNGDVIDFIATNYGCKAYACELDKYRAIHTSQKKVVKLLNADAIYGVSKNTWWAGLNFLNPPYGVNSEGRRLENLFVQSWGGVTSRMGVLILVINPSTLNEDMAETLRKQGYKLICSIYDKDNEDYKNYDQFFIILQRIGNSFRESEEKILNAWDERIEIDDLDIDKFEITTGRSPEYFREYDIPKWKMDEAMKRSNIYKMFENEIRIQDYMTSSIESPNDGQAALLIASGALSNDIIEVVINGETEKIITKGTVYKYQKVSEKCNADGDLIGVCEIDAYKTELYALSLTKGEYIKCT